jgi:hypothetical protein
MRKTLLLLVPALAVFAHVAQAKQQPRFDTKSLSERGQRAYQELSEAKVFRLGGVGYAAETSEEERALRALLVEDAAVKALESLVDEGSPEGGLYGLVGLRQKDMAAFRRAYGRYVAKEEPPERPSFAEGLRTPKGKVATQAGCIGMTADRKLVAGMIDFGHFDELLKRGID